VVTLVLQAFAPLLELGVNGRSFSAGIMEMHLHNSREFATDRHRKLDDEPYGGGSDNGFGDGCIIAILKGSPDLTSSNLELV
jgi:tRNA (guanine-N1)-methyltransferase